MADGGELKFEDTQPVDVPQKEATNSSKELKFEDTAPMDELKFEDTQPTDHDKYGTPGQKALTALEGAGQGYAGFLSTGAEKLAHYTGADDALGVDLSAEAQKARAEENPVSHGVGTAVGLGAGLLTGTGEAALIGKAGKAAAEAANLGKIGSAVVQGALDSSLFQGSDEVSKALLGQGDPQAPVATALAHMGMAGLIGAGGGAAFGIAGKAAGKGLDVLAANKIGTKAESFMHGVGAASEAAKDPKANADMIAKTIEKLTAIHESGQSSLLGTGSESLAGVDPKAFKAGAEFYTKGLNALKNTASEAVPAGVAGTVAPGNWPAYMVLQKVLKPILGPVTDKLISPANKYGGEIAKQLLTKGKTSGVFQMMDYANTLKKGNSAVTRAVDGLFTGGSALGQNAFEAAEKDREKLKQYIEDGGVNQELAPHGAEQKFAEGGSVAADNQADNHFAHVFPEQNVLMNAAKARISNYLNGLRPLPPTNRAPYDTVHEQPRKERSYNHALDLANQPLSILNHIKDGSLNSEKLTHFKSMYPELHQLLSSKINQKMLDGNLKQEAKPSYPVRQAMTLFLGAPVDSNLTSASILAAQPKPSNPSPQSQPKSKKLSDKGGSALAKGASMYRTPEQAAEIDDQDRR